MWRPRDQVTPGKKRRHVGRGAFAFATSSGSAEDSQKWCRIMNVESEGPHDAGPILWLPACSNRVFKTQGDALIEPLRPFELQRSNRYGFLANVRAAPIDYSIGYQTDQGVSPTFSAHLEQVADAVERVSSRESSICEIGCGKGDFFSMLAARSFTMLTGFDESYEGGDSRIKKSYPSAHDGPLEAQLLVVRHVLDYIVDPVTYLVDLHKINGQDCEVMIEVPCFDWISSQGALWDLTSERVNFFTEQSIEALFGSDLIGIDRVFGEQYLLVHAHLRGRDEVADYFEADAYQSELLKHGYALSSDLTKQLGDSAYWIWGTGSKAVMFLHHHLNWRPEHAPLGCVDINPMRQGTFVPSTGIEIFSPSEFGELFDVGQPVVVLNRNYINEVSQSIEELTGASAELIVL